MLVTAPTNWPLSVEVNLTAVSLGKRWPWASVMVAVALVVDCASARMVGGFRTSVIPAGDPAVWDMIAEPVAEPSVAVMVGVPTVVEALIVTLYVPLWWLVTALMAWSGSLDVKPTVVSLGSKWPKASLTVAVAVVVLVPSAGTVDDVKATAIGDAGGPATWLRVVVPDFEPSVAVIVAEPTVVEAVICAL